MAAALMKSTNDLAGDAGPRSPRRHISVAVAEGPGDGTARAKADASDANAKRGARSRDSKKSKGARKALTRTKSSAVVIASALLRLDHGIPISKADLDDDPAHSVEERIRVAVRIRPMPSASDDAKKRGSRITMKVAKVVNQGAIAMASQRAREPKVFNYDHVFGFLSGYNATTFCYGQTASGKTWTMMGDEARVEHLGIVPRSLITIFDWASTGPRECVIHLSALEIYNETLLDLGRRGDASDFKLEIRESPDIGVHVQNLNHVEVVDIEEASRMVEHVINSRHVSSTEMNERSSRSHLIFQVHLSQVDHGDTERVTERHSVLCMVDLAGSERVGRAQKVKGGLRALTGLAKEGANINLSLSALGNCINALVLGKAHVPFRDSKLTRLLQNSLGGNSSTVMVANISPSSTAYNESLSTLRFAERVKQVKTLSHINYDPAYEEMVRLKQENDALRSERDSLRARVQQLEASWLEEQDVLVHAPLEVRPRKRGVQRSRLCSIQ